MEKNLILEYHDSTNKTYKHLAHTVNLILRKDFDSIYSISYRTLERYAVGDTLPTKTIIIKAIAKMLKVEPLDLVQNLKEYRKNLKQRCNSDIK